MSDSENNCAIYARYSSNKQKYVSIVNQIRNCRDAAEEKGWTILEDNIYTDEARSGTRVISREGLKEMLRVAMSNSCPFQRIIVDDTSRVARNTKEALDIFSLLSFYGIHVYYVSQGIDTSNETAEEMLTINGLIDSLFIRNLASKTREGIKGQILKGYSGGGRRYGYRSDPVYNGKVDIYGIPEADGYILKINVDEANVILRIFQLFGEKGYSAKKIVNILNKEIKETGGPLPPRGSFWCVSTILGSKKAARGILNNEIYIGKYYWNRSKIKKNPDNGQKKRISKNEAKWVVVAMPKLRIIPDDLWQKAKKRQKTAVNTSNGEFMKAKPAYSVNLITGLAKCSICGGNIVVVSGGRFGKYGCSNNWNKGDSVCTNATKIKKADLHRLIIQATDITLDEPDVISYLCEKVVAIVKVKINNSKQAWKGNALETQIKKVKREIGNFINAIRVGIISDEVRLNLQTSEKKKLELESLMIDTQKEQLEIPFISNDFISGYIKDLDRTLNLLPVMGRSFLSQVFDTIIIEPIDTTIRIHVSYRKKGYARSYDL